MATKNINEQDRTAKVDQEADVLISQVGDGSESGKRVLRRASIAAMIAALRNAGVNSGYVSEEAMRRMYPDLVKAVEPSENGIIVQYFDGAEQEIPIESGGLAFDEVYFDQDSGFLHIRLEGEDVVDPCFIGGGGGSGGGSASVSYVITIQNLLESRNLTEAEGQPINIRFRYSSVDEEGVDDGPGVGTIYVGGVKAATVTVVQGENTIDVSPYLSAGDNSVKIKVENSEGVTKSINYTATVVALSMKTTLTELMTCSGDVVFYYTPTGSGDKTIHFLMDGEELGTSIVTSSGRSQRYTISEQDHGGHLFEAYAEMQIGELTLKSNVIRLGMIWVDATSTDAAVVTTFGGTTATQGENLSLPYMAYDPTTESATVRLRVMNEDGSEYSSTTAIVDRTGQMWNVQDYPAGNVKFRIELGTAFTEVEVAVSPSEIVIESIKDGLVFDFNPSGRSNLEADPAHWESTDRTVVATFDGVGFAGSDGWLSAEDGSPMLRLLPGSSMNIPFTLFNVDHRDHGVAVEVEMASHNVRDYDSVVMSCLSNGIGFKIASQYAQFNSEQTQISMQFKEDERVRVSFVVEPKSLNRLIYIYVNGVMCGAIQYANDDNFQQSPPTGITIGANSSGIDIFRIMMYDGGLTRSEVLANYIADRPTYGLRLEAYKRNDLLDVSEELVISRLPATLPYMIIHCDRLPQYKGDKLTCSVTFVNNADSSRSFTATGVQIDVQGTSSAGYKKKNFKQKFKSGIEYTVSMSKSDTYQMRSNSVPVSTFCMKADVASSEGANNVELVSLYEDTCPYSTPPQEADSRVRVGIDGFPIVIFWNNTATGETKFWGKYNFNNDKSTAEVYGLTDGCESWEICNNTSDRVVFKKSDYSDASWKSDFEARFPEDNTDFSRLKRMTDWVVSTDRTAATDRTLSPAATFGDATYDNDTAEYRLAKFKAQFTDYFVKAPMLFYYLFTEVFLMVDNRAKNFFPTTFDGVHWMPLPYDMDTAIGINNEGKLTIEYDLEDTDDLNGGDVFNGQKSVLWCNIRDAFADEIKEMYAALRNGSIFNYKAIIQRFKAHQSVWPEAVWNEDAYEKYLEPLVSDNDSSYLPMLQGDKESQRDWWLFNGFRYRDSKYQTGDAQSNYITLRCYAVGDITVIPYSHIWPRIKYGSYTVTERGKRNQKTKLVCPLDDMNDTEVYIYSADRLSEIGDLSGLNVGYADFSMATKLQKLKVGDGDTEYQNTKMEELYVGNNEMLTELDFRHCSVLAQNVDLSGCISIEKVLGEGSAIPSVTLPVGGKLKMLELPGTITNLTIRNQKEFETLTMPSYGSVATLRIENTPNIPISAIINGSTALNRVRLVGVEWREDSEASLIETLNKLESCGGLDASGSNTDKAVVSGRLYVPSITVETLQRVFTDFPEVVVIVDGKVNYLIRYLNYDNTVLYNGVVAEGGNAIDPVADGLIAEPTKPGTNDSGYKFVSFGDLPTNVRANATVIAQYTTTHAVRFLDGQGEVVNTQWVIEGQNAVDPVANGLCSAPTKTATAQYNYTFFEWVGSPGVLQNITEACRIESEYTAELRTYTVRFINDGELLFSQNVDYGQNAIFVGNNPTKVSTSQYHYTFLGWSRTEGGEVDENAMKNITSDTNIYAIYENILRVYYEVKFYNGSTLLYTDTVEGGGNATYGGSTPTKAQSVQYTYTFAGWALTDGGSANTNALRNITAARSVFAAYSATVRKYTVYFYNGSTLLQTVSNVPYGGSATYTGSTPVSPDGSAEDYPFEGWSPAPSNITGTTSCYAQFGSPAPVFETTNFALGYGVEWDYSQSTTKLTRLGLASGFGDPAPATSLSAQGSSPFDNVMPWAGMKRYNVINGEISYSEDDAGFSMSEYDTVVYIPPFYYAAYKDETNSKWRWAISPTEKEGFALHPGSGRYIGRYHTSGDSTAVYSKPGTQPLVNTARPNFRTYSHNKGSNWWMIDIATWSALQLLFMVEFADLNSQRKLGKGYGSGSQALGTTDAAVYHTYNGGDTTNQYRWIEQPWGRVLDWVDGFVAASRACYIGTNNSTFTDSTSSLRKADTTLPYPGWITGLGYSNKFPWAMLPDTASNGSSSTFIPDYVYSSSGTYALSVGGGYKSSDYCGLFYFDANSGASGTYSNLGSRLLYIP